MKRIIKKCVVCRKGEGPPYNYGKAPDLPSSRVSDNPPFTNVGLGFAGPLFDKERSTNQTRIETRFTFCYIPARQSCV